MAAFSVPGALWPSSVHCSTGHIGWESAMRALCSPLQRVPLRLRQRSSRKQGLKTLNPRKIAGTDFSLSLFALSRMIYGRIFFRTFILYQMRGDDHEQKGNGLRRDKQGRLYFRQQ